jgi:molybdopterin-synthase adenylyltransferase
LNYKFLEKELKKVTNPMSSISRRSIKAIGTGIPGASDRQKQIAGFDQAKFSQSHVLCIGAGGLISNIAPALVRKGIGALTILDADNVEASNLNRQRFYPSDIGQNKAIALVRNLQRECIYATRFLGLATSLESAIAERVDLACDVAICGVDNNPARVAAARFFRSRSIPVIFVAVDAQADHGYVFIQDHSGPCIGCVFPDIGDDESYPCPGTPAISDVLQLVGAITTYAVDSLLMGRKRDWNYRAVYLSTGQYDWSGCITMKSDCRCIRQ